MLKENYVLSNGLTIPKLGLGTWQMTEEEAERASLYALKFGYRQIDTAAAYGNEAGVGRAVRACGADREKIFITTKVKAECKSAESARECIENSLRLLGTDYIDLLLIHAPMPWDEICGRSPRPAHRYEEQNVAVWRVIEEYVAAGKVKSAGVSNFENGDLDNILAHCKIKPVVNQVCCHIGNTPRDAIDYNSELGVLIQAYSPNATGRILTDGAIREIADRYGVSVPQLAVRYCLQLGCQPLPKTSNPAHIEENARLDFVISDKDMSELENLGRVRKVRDK